MFNSAQSSCAFSLHHEYSHCGNAWHEFADSVCAACNHFREHTPYVPERNPTHVLACRPDAAQWLFLAALPPDEGSQYPLHVCGDDMFLSSQSCPVARIGIPGCDIARRIDEFQQNERRIVENVADKEAIPSLRLRGIQVHALTLRAQTKLQLYIKQFNRDGVHFFGAQETRRKRKGVSTEGQYTILDSPCNADGSGGVMFGISNKSPLAAELDGCPLPLTVPAVDVNIVKSKPQSLIVRVHAPRFQCLFHVVHGHDAS